MCNCAVWRKEMCGDWRDKNKVERKEKSGKQRRAFLLGPVWRAQLWVGVGRFALSWASMVRGAFTWVSRSLRLAQRLLSHWSATSYSSNPRRHSRPMSALGWEKTGTGPAQGSKVHVVICLSDWRRSGDTSCKGRSQRTFVCRWYDNIHKRPQNTTKELLQLINTFSEVAGNKINLKKKTVLCL